MNNNTSDSKRWYEKNPEMFELVSFLQTMTNEQQAFVTQHLLQILFNECSIDLDVELSSFSSHNYAYKRWYDENYDLSSSFELLKNLPENKQNFVIRRLLTEIVMAFAKKEI